MTLGHLPWKHPEHAADAVALADDQVQLTYAELEERSAAVAARFAEAGLGRGDVVAAMLPNRAELLLTILAAWRLGATATPVNPAFTAAEAGHQLGDSGAKLVVTIDGTSPVDGLPGIGVDDLAPQGAEHAAPVDLQPGDLALLIYTSGSTGRPKGVMLTHANADAMTRIACEHFQITSADHCLLILPLFHVNALMISALSPLRAGGRVTITGTFSPSRFFDDVERLRPTYFSAVPTIYAILAALPEDVQPDTSSLRFVVCGAAPVTKELLETSQRRYGFTILEGYGLTEGTCASACNPLDGPRKLGTVGPALPGQRIEIAGSLGGRAPVGEAGEVLISGPTVMKGYLNNPEATASAIDADGWLHTGDVGRLDEDGYLTLVDRVKDMIIRGGENLYPKEIESTIAEVEGVLEVAVVGRPDEVLGEVPVARVVLYPGSTVSAGDLLAHCRERLMRVKVPVDLQIVDALPKNPVGKIDKPSLRRSLQPSA
ncbi:MAG: AMP-binding protein [Aeromicrobium sp.]|uniref:class I adenylate-forming enzyme family protein n=1 Tax=Aeromicrobium sp. TaxID=1871063 RepID=UPI0039E21760